MYLKHIKLAGFKSFVDPTRIPVGRHITSIVGPNGCGKSNIVDAIRWVIGESSAKQLRGQLMSDVIFNGSKARKPLGKAAVELHFSDCETCLSGEYAGYHEICIRREVVRDGASSYFLNGTACRRRDIIDIFLGTGLGPHGYSVIEQGMVARLIESKPDELRQQLEEVAGISKYKERRRETHNRMRHTEENLQRLDDLREELAKRLRHLKRQANAAERYRDYTAQEQQLQQQADILRWQALAQQLKHAETQIQTQTLQQEKVHTELVDRETRLLERREHRQQHQQQRDAVQKQYYDVTATVTRMEQQLAHLRSQQQQKQQDAGELEHSIAELQDSMQQHQQHLEEVEQVLSHLAPQTDTIQQQVSDHDNALQEAETNMRAYQQQWETEQAGLAKLHGEIQVNRTRLEHVQQQQNSARQQSQQASQEMHALDVDRLQVQLEGLSQPLQQLSEQLTEKRRQLAQSDAAITQQRQRNQQQRQVLQQQREVLQQQQREQHTLQALQEAALRAQHSDTVNQWLDAQQLQSADRLGEQLAITAGWELAVETVLGYYLDTLCVGNMQPLMAAIHSLPSGQLSLQARHTQSSVVDATVNGSVALTRLTDKINSDYQPAWLACVYVAEDVERAQPYRSQLQAYESIITRDGVWLGPDWLRVHKKSTQQDSVLWREQRLRELQQQINESEQHCLQTQNALQHGEQRIQQLEQQQREQHQHSYELTQKQAKLQKELSSCQAEWQYTQQRRSTLQHTIEQSQASLTEADQQLSSLSEQQQQLTDQQAVLQRQCDVLKQQREQAQQHVAGCRVNAQQSHQQLNELSVRMAANHDQQRLLQDTLERDDKRLQQLQQREVELKEYLATQYEPEHELQQQLQTGLQQRVAVEKSLQTAQQVLEEDQETMRQLENQQRQLANQLDQEKDKLTQLQMDRESIVTRQATILEQMGQEASAVEQLLSQLPQEVNLEQTQQQQQALRQRIEQLGAVNLAAIDEYQSTLERKDYLDKQHEDLHQALEILRDAIRKIDQQTRQTFSETFTKVNEAFQQIYPQIFSGGQASLVLEENDWLNAGVLVKAQPPGKRNATIHMLSGGEKALTATALIFALFKLNPAPFCVLDEVDAPLDDANVGRFCALIKEMSKDIQFLIISHNKLTIATAEQLMGVTMQEPGVSRLVAVDMQDAVSMAEA